MLTEQRSVGSNESIVSALGVSISTIERVRRRFVEEGIDAALSRRRGSGRKQRRLDGEKEAYLLAIACSEPPQGQGRWTLRLLADKMVELDYVESLCHETVRQALKKMNFSLGEKSVG